ncbi:MAG: hypothetical protein AAGA64_06405 [Bacteroidota bacterium]
MAKLFIFGIGGTGSRVIKALTMLLAAGVEVPGMSEIIPIIIDPDKANGDLNRTLDILAKYQGVRKHLDDFDNNGFFKTKITTLPELEAARTEPGKVAQPAFSFNLNGVDEETFREFIDYENLDQANQALVHLLFSDANLASRMEVGFKGNPNIGSVVLNQLKDSKEFNIFASNFEENDRIFIICSIFGGTGAAGFPLILKNIRNAEREQSLNNAYFLTNARIGAITLLPYFGVESTEESQIDKSTFVSKAKSALAYYLRNIIGNKTINAIYFLGDKVHKDYENVEGARNQKNDAHFVELVAALSIIDFATMSDTELESAGGKSVNELKVKEYGIKEDVNDIHFATLGGKTSDQIKTSLIQFQYFTHFMEHRMEASIVSNPWADKNEPYIDDAFIRTNVFYTEYLQNFCGYYREWISEMASNKRAFKPFRDVKSDQLFEMVNGQAPINRLLQKKNFYFYEDRLNGSEKTLGTLKVEDKFMSLFYLATESIAKEKFNTQRFTKTT